jgi:phage replication O-like protein O
MPNPQIENGHLDLANEIVEQFARLNLCPGEWRVLWAILRKTYSWHKKADRISYSQLEKMTGLDRWHVRRYLTRLIRRNIITRTGSGQRLEYGFQKDYSKWQPLPKQATVATVAQIGYEPLPKQATKPLPKQATTKEKKETYKRKKVKLSKLPINPDQIYTLDEILKLGKDKFECVGYNQFRLK